MKKILLSILIAFILLFCGCASEMNLLTKNNMSDLRVNYFEGKTENYYANFSSGYREKIFNYDGISTAKTQCGVLTFYFLNEEKHNTLGIVLKIDETEKEYILEKNPYDDNYMCDIEQKISNSSDISISIKNDNNFFVLENKSNNWKVNYKKAISIGVNHFKCEINGLVFNNKINAECYLKIISKPDFDYTLWYFSIIDRAGNLYSCSIDVNSGLVTATNNK